MNSIFNYEIGETISEYCKFIGHSLARDIPLDSFKSEQQEFPHAAKELLTYVCDDISFKYPRFVFRPDDNKIVFKKYSSIILHTEFPSPSINSMIRFVINTDKYSPDGVINDHIRMLHHSSRKDVFLPFYVELDLKEK